MGLLGAMSIPVANLSSLMGSLHPWSSIWGGPAGTPTLGSQTPCPGVQQWWYPAVLHPKTLCPMMLPLKSMMVPRRVALGLPGWRSPSIHSTQDAGWRIRVHEEQSLADGHLCRDERGQQDLAQAGNHPTLPCPAAFQVTGCKTL